MLTTPQGGVAVVQAAGMVPENGSAHGGPGNSPAAGEQPGNFNSDSEYGEDGDPDFAEDTPAPAVPSDWVKLVEGDLKCSSRSFYQRFLSDEVCVPTKSLGCVTNWITNTLMKLLCHCKIRDNPQSGPCWPKYNCQGA